MAAVMLLLLSSCNSIFDDYPEDEQATILLSIDGAKTRAGDLFADDAVIEKIRIIVFTGAALEINEVFNSGEASFDNPFRVKVATGTKNVYVIANETTGLTASLTSGSLTETGLKAIMADDTTSGLSSPLVMTGEIPSVELLTASLHNATVTLKRVAAKINLSFKKGTATDDVQITKVSLLSNTGKSTLWEGSTFTGTQSYWSHVVSNPMSLTSSLQDYLTVYVYENLGNSANNKANATQLEVEALFNSIPTKYRVYVNETIESGSTITPGDPSSSDLDKIDSPYNIKRNYSYNITGTIVNIGEFDGLMISTNVLPWSYLPSSVLYDYNFTISPQPTESQREYTLGGTGTAIEFTFTLTNPINTLWIAQLSNPIDFEFVGASIGTTGETVTLTIKPKHAADDTEERTTEFYITANNAEIPIISGLSQVGSGNRVIIKQPAMP